MIQTTHPKNSEGEGYEDIEEIKAGSIGAAVGLKNTKTGNF